MQIQATSESCMYKIVKKYQKFVTDVKTRDAAMLLALCKIRDNPNPAQNHLIMLSLLNSFEANCLNANVHIQGIQDFI